MKVSEPIWAPLSSKVATCFVYLLSTWNMTIVTREPNF